MKIERNVTILNKKARFEYEILEEIEAGKVKMTDIVNFKMPFGMFGDLVGGALVKNKVRCICESRFTILEKYFTS